MFTRPYVVQFDDDPGVSGGTATLTFPVRISYVRVAYAPINFRIHAGYGVNEPLAYVAAGDAFDFAAPVPVDQLTLEWDVSPAVPGADYAKAIIVVSDQYLGGVGKQSAPVLLGRYDSLGQIRGWYPLGSGESITNRTASSALVDIVTSPLPVERRRYTTFDVVPRRTARDHSTNVAFAAPGRTQLVTIWPGANPVHLISADVAVMETTAAAEIWVDLIRISSATQPSGGSNHTPVSRSGADTALSEVRRIPSTPGVETGDPFSSVVYKLGVTGAVSTVNPAPAVIWQPLVRLEPWETEAISAASGGLAIVGDSNAAATVRFAFRLTFVEVT